MDRTSAALQEMTGEPSSSRAESGPAKPHVNNRRTSVLLREYMASLDASKASLGSLRTRRSRFRRALVHLCLAQSDPGQHTAALGGARRAARAARGPAHLRPPHI